MNLYGYVGGKQWQTTPKYLPRMQRTGAIPVAWLNSGLCPNRPRGRIPIIKIIIDMWCYIEDWLASYVRIVQCLGLVAVRVWEGGYLILWGCQRFCLERWCGRRLGGFQLCVQCECGIFRWCSGVFVSFGDVILALCCLWGQRSVHCPGGVVQNWKYVRKCDYVIQRTPEPTVDYIKCK